MSLVWMSRYLLHMVYSLETWSGGSGIRSPLAHSPGLWTSFTVQSLIFSFHWKVLVFFIVVRELSQLAFVGQLFLFCLRQTYPFMFISCHRQGF